MKKNQDKSISTIILFLSGLAIIWWFYNYYLSPNNQGVVEVYNLKTIVSWGAKNSDLLLIIYIFLCLQLAGLSEFKQRQDYLIVALISLVFTPIGLLFIKDEKEKRDE